MTTTFLSTQFPFQIRTSGKDVIASGTVLTADNRNVEFQLAHLRVIMEFITDSSPTRMEGKENGPSELTLSLYNFNNSIGAGTTSPIEIGTLNGRKLLLAFMIYALSDSSIKNVHYTFLLNPAD